MRAAVCERYGPPEVVRIVEVPKPQPEPDEVLIRVRATTVNSGDARVRAARVPRGVGLPFRLSMGWSAPKQGVLGFELAGDVEAVGSRVRQFKLEDRVIGSGGFTFRCHAEYRCIAEAGAIAIIPEGMSYPDAVALLFGGVTSLAFFGEGKLKRGEHLLVNGASGAVGVMAIQIAKHIGAEVTAVCSGSHADLVRALGADHVIDYTQSDFTQAAETYDVIMDNHGNAPYARVKHLLRPGGRFLLVIGDLWQMITAGFNKAIISTNQDGRATNAENYRHLLDLAQRRVLKPVIDKAYPFEDIVEAHRHVDTGHKTGSVVLTLG